MVESVVGWLVGSLVCPRHYPIRRSLVPCQKTASSPCRGIPAAVPSTSPRRRARSLRPASSRTARIFPRGDPYRTPGRRGVRSTRAQGTARLFTEREGWGKNKYPGGMNAPPPPAGDAKKNDCCLILIKKIMTTFCCSRYSNFWVQQYCKMVRPAKTYCLQQEDLLPVQA